MEQLNIYSKIMKIRIYILFFLISIPSVFFFQNCRKSSESIKSEVLILQDQPASSITTTNSTEETNQVLAIVNYLLLGDSL